VPDIFVNNTTVYENDTVEFNGSASYDLDGFITSYSWDFDDGNPPITGYFPVVTNEFNESRIFNVTLTVFDNNGTYDTTWILIDVLPNEVPNAVIDEPFDTQPFSVNDTIEFNASSSSDPNDVDLEYHWDFDDGSVSGWMYEPVTTYHYSDVGPFPFYEYTVTLTVRDNEGLEDIDTVTIIVNNYPPVAIAKSDMTAADTYQNITFDGSDSYDPPPSPGALTYLWDFDDGEISFEPVVEHQFIQNGVYNVTLTVFDGIANDTDWIIISIANRKPDIINVTVDPASPIVNEEVTITINAIDEDGTIERYYWNFGDGDTYFENTTDFSDGTFDGITTHTYTLRGTYNVLIEVTDDDTFTNSTAVVIMLVNAVPEVSITDPTQNETVAEITTISGTSSDRDGSVSQVQVKIDEGNWVGAQDTSSDNSWSTWSYDWDTEDGYVNGDHMIYARAYDNENYTDPPANVSVTVDNLPTSITATINLDPESVEEEGTVSVFGTVIYNTGDPVEDALINITILNEVGSWETTTSSGGSYTVDITAPDASDNYRVYVDAEKDSFTDTQYEFLTVTPVPEKPDLTLTNNDIDFNPSAPFSGETVQITITVSNNGDSNANNVLVNVYDGNPQTGGTSIGSKIASVNANSQTDVIVDWTTTGITGTFSVNVILDPNDDIEEDDESNNQAQKPITIAGKPDFTLEATDIIFSNENPNVGDSISIRITIYNDGSESGTVTYGVYEGDPDLGGLLIESMEETISKNDDKNVIVQWTPEEGGDYDIYVVLDPDDDVDEIDEDNNKRYATISVEEEPTDGGLPSWLPIAMIVIVVVVVIILLFMYMKSKGPRQPRPQKQELPLAQVVESEPKQQAKTVAAKEVDENEVEASMGGHGGIRIG
jgi:PKD repeat protein